MPVVASVAIWVLVYLVVVFSAARYATCSQNSASKEQTSSSKESISLDVSDDDIQSQGCVKLKSAFPVPAVVVGLAITAFVAWFATFCAQTPAANVELWAVYVAVTASALIDAKTRTIPNAIPLVLIGIRILCVGVDYATGQDALGYLMSSLVGCGACFLVFFVAGRVAHGGVGGGDIKLVSAVGFACGFHVVMYTLVFAMVACAVAAGWLLAVKKRGKESSLPFAPFLYFGYCAAIVVSAL